MSIVLSQGGNRPVRLNRTTIADEAYLQKYIYDHPETLPFDQLDEDAVPLVLVREFPTPSGAIDALATDANAHLYVIETKLYKNPDKRLVLAQMLDYGAALWKAYDDPDDFVSRLDTLMTERGGKGLSARLKEAFSLEGQALVDFIDGLKNAIADGEFRFVVLMDRVDDRLKDLIQYVNANSKFDIFGVGLDFYEHQDIRILIPTLYGSEAKKEVTGPTRKSHTWDEESLFADAATRVSPETLAAMRALHAWALETGAEISYGAGKKGSFTPKCSTLRPKGPISVFADGTLVVKLSSGWFDATEVGTQFHDALVRELAAEGVIAPGVHTSEVWLSAEKWRDEVVPLTGALTRAVASALTAT